MKDKRSETTPAGAEERLQAYRSKRSAGSTPEPFGGAGELRPGLFVVQKHAARQLHYDFRIAVGGVLLSWAIPKGPSLDPAEKRFAVATEDHPLEYGDFEGVVPPGNYGAGSVIVWDRGLCVPHIDHEQGLADGKLLFELRGYKLRGLWTLVKTKADRQWLLIKKPDGWASGEGAEDLEPGSVLSGLTVEELASGGERQAEVLAELAELGAPEAAVDPARGFMLAELRRQAFSAEGWIFELKYDGFRLRAEKSGTGRGAVQLFYRSGRETTAAYPELRRALQALPYDDLLLDGEVVVLDEQARPSFQALQKRARLSRPIDLERATVERPATYFAFDLLAFGGYDLRRLPLMERKRLLQRLLPAAGPLRFADHVDQRGEDFYTAVRDMGLEGVVAKRADSTYQAGRSGDWLKLRADLVGDFAVVGFRRPDGQKSGLKSLHIGVLTGPQMTYAGSVGSGLSAALEKELLERLEPLRRKDPPFVGQPPAGVGELWVEPRLVVEVRFTEYTEAGHLRHPTLLRLRHDKRPEDCLREDIPPPLDAPVLDKPAAAPREQRFSRLEKVFWPEEGYTKGDLIDYYRAVSPWLLPYLRDRPLVLDRYPDGIDGKSFFQKNAPDFAPDWVRTTAVWSQDTGQELEYFVCDDESALLYLANLGTIPLHVWSSRVDSLQKPDWAILDLDAKQAPFTDVVEVALEARRLCERIGLDCYAKTSGATGMHVLMPLGGRCTHEQARQLAELLARLVAHELPEISSVARSVAERRGRVYIDFLQNGYGKLLVAPFSVRPRPGAPVSMPVAWHEVEAGLDPASFTLSSAVRRLQKQARDPLADVLERVPDLAAVLAQLAASLEDADGRR